MDNLTIPPSEMNEKAEDSGNESGDTLMALQELSLNTDQNDHAKLSENPQFKKMLIKYGDNFPASEDVIYSRIVTKVCLMINISCIN